MRLIEEELNLLKTLRLKRKSELSVQPPDQPGYPVKSPERPVQPPDQPGLPIKSPEHPVQPPDQPELPVHSPELPVQPPHQPGLPIISPEHPAPPPDQQGLPVQSPEHPVQSPDVKDPNSDPQVPSENVLTNPIADHHFAISHDESKPEPRNKNEKEFEIRSSLVQETEPDIKIQKLNLNQEHQSPEIPSQLCLSDRDSEKLDHCEPKLVHTGLNPEPEYDECRSDLQSPLIENHFFPSKPEN